MPLPLTLASAAPGRRIRVLGCGVDVLSMDEATDRLVGLVEDRLDDRRHPALVVTLNPEMVMLARRDRSFRELVNHADLNIPDGIGLVRALRRRGAPEAVRVSGADLVDSYLPHAAALGHRVALLGAGPGVAAAAAAEYRRRYPSLVATADAGDPGPETAARVAETQPDVLLAAYGHGRQERFLAQYLPQTGAVLGIGVGGTLDYVAGRIRRAPALVRSAGLEWAWRLVREPARVRRQSVLPAFWWQEHREVALHPGRYR